MRTKLILGIILALLIAALALPGCTSETEPTNTPAPAPAAKTYEWKFQAHMPPGSITTGANLDKLIEMIETNTNGQVKITRYPSDSIVGMMEMLEATGTGVLDIAVTTAGHWQGAIPVAAVENGVPQGWRNNYEMEEILWDYGLEDLARGEYAKRDVYLLTDFSAAPAYLTVHLKQPIETLDDLQGKKIRAFGSYLDILGKLGASPVSMALGEVYSAIATGTLDGGFFATSWSGPAKMYEVAPYLIFPPIDLGGTHSWLVNQAKWDELPPDLQTIVNVTAKEWASWVSRYYNPRFMPTLEQMDDWGFKRIELNEADQQKVFEASLEIWDDIAAKDPVAAQGIQIMKDYFKEIGRPGF